jgi:hypothetical protein
MDTTSSQHDIKLIEDDLSLFHLMDHGLPFMLQPVNEALLSPMTSLDMKELSVRVTLFLKSED